MTYGIFKKIDNKFFFLIESLAKALFYYLITF